MNIFELVDIIFKIAVIAAGLIGGYFYVYERKIRNTDDAEESTYQRQQRAITALEKENSLLMADNKRLDGEINQLKTINEQNKVDIQKLTDLLVAKQDFKQITDTLTKFLPVLVDIQEFKSHNKRMEELNLQMKEDLDEIKVKIVS